MEVYEHPDYKRGRAFARGVIEEAGRLALFGFLGFMLYFLADSTFGWRLDDTDKDGWNRSGVKLIKDHGTGQEYLYRDGALIKREPKPE